MRILGFVLVLLLSFGAAHADDSVRQELALEIVELTTTGTMVDQMVDAIWPNLEGGIVARAKNPSDEVLAEMKAEYKKLVEGLIGSVIGDVSGFYADNYSEQELHELLAFYRSDLGKKTLAIAPKLMGEIMPSMMQKMQQELPATMQKFYDLVDEKGLVEGENR